MTHTEVWQELLEEVHSAAAKAIGYWPGGLILATVSSANRPKLLIEFKGDESSKATLDIEGLILETEMVTIDERVSRCLSLTPRESQFDELFYPIVDYLVEHLHALDSEKNDLDNVEAIISEWISFFREKVERGSKEAILGLVGELIAIRDVLDLENAEPHYWQGPAGGIQDFRFSKDRLEVKVLGTRTGPKTHRISSLHQLVIPENGRLYFLSMRISIGIHGAHSVHELVTTVRSMSLFSSVAGKKHFDESLRAVGYSEELVEKYSHFDLLDLALFEVTEDFPRLVPSMISADSRVLDVKYSLDLSGLDDLQIDLESGKLHLS
jgi:hypothetical protein